MRTLIMSALEEDCVDKRFGEAKRAILIQEGGLARNIDLKSATHLDSILA